MNLRSVLTRLQLGRFTKAAILIASGAVLGQLVSLAVAPILTRLYTPEQFGLLGAYVALLSMASVVATLRYEIAIPLPDSDQEGAEVLVVSLISVVVVTLLSALTFVLLADHLVAWLKEPSLASFLWMVPLGVFLVGIAQTLNYWAIRKQAFRAIAQTKLSQGVGGSVGQVILGFAGMGSWGLIIGDLIGRIAGTSSLLIQAWRSDAALLRNIVWGKTVATAKRYYRFPLLSAPSSIINSAGIQLPTLLLAAMYGTHVAGYYALTQKVVAGGLFLLAQPIGQVYVSKFTSEATLSNQQKLALLQKTTWRLLTLAVLPLLVLGLVAPTVFSWIFGEPWRLTGTYVQLQIPQYLSSFVVIPISQTLSIANRQDLQLYWDIGRLVAILTVFSVGWLYKLEPAVCIALISTVLTISYLYLYWLCYKTLNKSESGVKL